MIFRVKLTKEAYQQLIKLESFSRNKVLEDYRVIEEIGLDRITDKKFLEKGLYEIRTDNIRSLFGYRQDQIIIVGLIFIKKTQKTPKRFIEQAKRNIDNYKE
jgi:phage-related protein